MANPSPVATFNDAATAAGSTYGGSNPTLGPPWVSINTPGMTQLNASNGVGYYGQAWFNPSTGEVMVANRGTQPTNIQNLQSDGMLAVLAGNQAEDVADSFAAQA